METVLLIMIIVGLAIAVFAGLAILLQVKPQALMPLVALLRKIGPVRRRMDDRALKAVAADPETAAEMMPAKEAEAFRKIMKSRSEEERSEVIEEATKLAKKGQTQKAVQVMTQKPKTESERRAQAKKKAASRAKRKQARKQRRR
jgi:hypothetical protein